jgi:hypothetical protein
LPDPSTACARDQVAASPDVFLKAALDFFGDDADRAFEDSTWPLPSAFSAASWFSPLQYAPTTGELKDRGLTALCMGLAQQKEGL